MLAHRLEPWVLHEGCRVGPGVLVHHKTTSDEVCCCSWHMCRDLEASCLSQIVTTLMLFSISFILLCLSVLIMFGGLKGAYPHNNSNVSTPSPQMSSFWLCESPLIISGAK